MRLPRVEMQSERGRSPRSGSWETHIKGRRNQWRSSLRDRRSIRGKLYYRGQRKKTFQEGQSYWGHWILHGSQEVKNWDVAFGFDDFRGHSWTWWEFLGLACIWPSLPSALIPPMVFSCLPSLSLEPLFFFKYLFIWLGLSCGMWDLSSLTRDWARIPCTGRWIVKHWATREVSLESFFISPCCSAAKLCLIICDPMDWSMPVFPIFRCLPEFA